ncbi:MAG: DUF2202 domain-containing protein [Bacteroidales bacterium]
MKTIKYMIISGFVVSLLLLTGSCTKETSDPAVSGYNNLLNVAADGTTLLVGSNLGTCLSEDLSFTDDELEILLHMKEEEKLARDVYTFLFEKWGTPVFSNISKAEDTHLNAVIYLLQNYGEEYTQTGEPGVFANSDFQELYSQLVEKGSGSVEAAMETGALIEELDIKDLEEYLEVVENENIKMVFENLLRGSRNHLRAFNRQLENLGVEYIPVYITQEEYDQIVSTPNETGNSNQSGNQQKRGRQYQGGR